MKIVYKSGEQKPKTKTDKIVDGCLKFIKWILIIYVVGGLIFGCSIFEIIGSLFSGLGIIPIILVVNALVNRSEGSVVKFECSENGFSYKSGTVVVQKTWSDIDNYNVNGNILIITSREYQYELVLDSERKVLNMFEQNTNITR